MHDTSFTGWLGFRLKVPGSSPDHKPGEKADKEEKAFKKVSLLVGEADPPPRRPRHAASSSSAPDGRRSALGVFIFAQALSAVSPRPPTTPPRPGGRGFAGRLGRAAGRASTRRVRAGSPSRRERA